MVFSGVIGEIENKNIELKEEAPVATILRMK